MATKIEWCDATWNPIFGCTKVSSGCANCYAEKMANRLAAMARTDNAHGKGAGAKEKYVGVVTDGRWNGRVVCDESALEIPLHWRKPRTIFVCSMSDLLHPGVPVEFIRNVFMVMDMCPQHRFMVLTKRAERMAEICADPPWFSKTVMRADGKKSHTCSRQILPNVRLGTSCEDQATADERIPHLLKCPAAGRFLSVEPLLDGVVLPLTTNNPSNMSAAALESGAICETTGIDQIIIGGESGARARPCHVEWIRGLIQQAKAAGVSCFVKQLGSAWAHEGGCTWCSRFAYVRNRHPKGGDPSEWPADLRVREQWR